VEPVLVDAQATPEAAAAAPARGEAR